MAAQQPPPEAKSLAIFSDGISSLSYLPRRENNSSTNTNDLLASTSWDGTVRIHDTVLKTAVLVQAMESGPLLSLATPVSKNVIVTGGMDGSIKVFDISTSNVRLVGRQGEEECSSSVDSSKNACSCLVSLDCGGDVNDNNSHLIASAGWNKNFYLWDIRQSHSSPVATLNLPGKAFAMDINGSTSTSSPLIVVATSGRRNVFVDCRKPDIVLDRESSLKFQTRCISFFPEGHGIALGSIEGRVGVEFLEEDEFKSILSSPPSPSLKRYAFKCHRVNDTVYPVNCIAFHPRFTSTFATGGCDGSVVLWDGLNKKKLTTINSFPTSISSIAFNHDGSEIAIASSYTHEEGDREHPQDEIYTRKILDSECIPKPK